jgi:DNA repair exonuclease SbcCD ATPase subunit
LSRDIEELEITPKLRAEVDRRADALMEANRIQAYLPRLRDQAEELEERLEELKELIRDEERALRDLRYEGVHSRSAIAQRRAALE